MSSKVDWQSYKSHAESNLYMLEHEIATDVTFLLYSEDGTVGEIKAHRYVLISRNPVFYAMLLSDTQDRKDKISITDILPDAFKALLIFIYSDSCQITPDTVLPILYASKKYIVHRLAKNCIQYLEKYMNYDNACLIYDHCLMYDEKDFTKKCEKFLELNTENVLKPQVITTLTEGALINLLKLPVVSVSEVSLFNACLVWGQNECKKKQMDPAINNLREILKNVIKHIHFPSMTNEEFGEVSRTGLLDHKERCTIFEYIAGSNELKLEIAKLFDFPTEVRQKPPTIYLKRFNLFSKSNLYTGDCTMMRLSCDKSIMIKGFGISSSFDFDPVCEVQVVIKHERKFLFSKSLQINDDMTGQFAEVMLGTDVIFQPFISYTVMITFHFSGEHDQGTCKRGKGGSKILSIDGFTFEFDRSDSGSLIPEIIFCKNQ